MTIVLYKIEIHRGEMSALASSSEVPGLADRECGECPLT
jgi:hypothetical protein